MRTLRLHQSLVHEGNLLLVNPQAPLKNDKQCALMVVDETHPDIMIEGYTAQALHALIEAVGGEGEIVPVSGYRSMAEQKQIWEDSIRKNGEEFTRRYVALPGCSEHQSGLAIDLGKASEKIDFIRPDFPYDGVCGTFRKLSASYGFIERYQQDKEVITGIGTEPWHFRYVGVPHAALMVENNLALEEYVAFLREKPRSVRLEDGRLVRVIHATAEAEWTTVSVPDGFCEVSGDNVRGFIITVWSE